jgi:hypothetical protein
MLPVRLPKILWAILVGVVVLSLMLATNVLRYVLVALAYQGAFVTAWVGVALAHVLLDRSNGAKSGGWSIALVGLPKFESAGMLAWLSGAGASLIVMHTGAPLNTLATPAALAVAGIVFAVLPKRTVPVLSK